MTPPADSPLFERAQEFVDRRRLVLGLCAAVAIALIAAVPGILTGDNSGRRVRTAEFAQVTPTTSPGGVVSPLAPQQVNVPTDASPAPTTTRPALVLGTTYTRPTPTTAPSRSAPKPAPKPAAPASTPPPPNGSPPPPSCHNSFDPACGAFRWDPDPGPNQPITGAVTSNQPAPGAKVTFTVTGDDPDAAPLQECNIDFGDNSGFHCDPQPLVNPGYCPKQYGPWTPPAKQDGKLNSTRDHAYATPGNYHVVFEVRSAMQECNNPYASTAKLEADIVVT
jgi:hypothetical protein